MPTRLFLYPFRGKLVYLECSRALTFIVVIIEANANIIVKLT